MLRLVVTPKTATIAPGALQQFTARLLDEEFIDRPPALKVKWSATGGTIDENGLFTAPNSDATVLVAAGVDNAENFDTAVVTVGKGGAVDRNAMQTSQYGETVGKRASIIARGDGRVTRQGEFVGDGAGQNLFTDASTQPVRWSRHVRQQVRPEGTWERKHGRVFYRDSVDASAVGRADGGQRSGGIQLGSIDAGSVGCAGGSGRASEDGLKF